MTEKWLKTAILLLLTVGILCAGFFLLDEVLNWGMDAVRFSSSEGAAEREMETDGDVEKAESRNLPIVMYHSVVEDASKRGPYVVTVEELKQDLKWIKDNGYETVLMEDLINFVNGQGDLPKKPFLITFDDGNYNNLYYVLPLLEEYEMKAVISAVGIYADQAQADVVQAEKNGGGDAQNPNYDYLTWEELKQLDQSPLVEVQNHTYDLHEFGKRRERGKHRGVYRHAVRGSFQNAECVEGKCANPGDYLYLSLWDHFRGIAGRSEGIGVSGVSFLL